MQSVADILKNKQIKSDFRNKHEYQAYGNMLADVFNDNKHRALYIKLAKNENRALLESAKEYVLNSPNATTKGKLFMWKLTQLKNSTSNNNSEN